MYLLIIVSKISIDLTIYLLNLCDSLQNAEITHDYLEVAEKPFDDTPRKETSIR